MSQSTCFTALSHDLLYSFGAGDHDVPCDFGSWLVREVIALFNPKTSTFVQKCCPYTGNLNSETSEDNKNVFLLCGDVPGPQVLDTCVCRWA